MHIETILRSKGTAVHTVRVDDPISRAIETLNSNRIGAVVVVDDRSRVAGILSERDIVRRMGPDPTAFLSTPVGQTMTKNVVTCPPDARLDDLMEIMSSRRIRHIPVVDDAGDLVGIVSIGDVVKRKIELAEHEASALRDYIAS